MRNVPSLPTQPIRLVVCPAFPLVLVTVTRYDLSVPTGWPPDPGRHRL